MSITTEMINTRLREELYWQLGCAATYCLNHQDAALENSIKQIIEIEARLREPKLFVFADPPTKPPPTAWAV
jgi:hypothetical protein